MKERPKIELTCAYSGEKFLKDRREYDRQVRNGKTAFYKDRETSAKAIAENRIIKPILESRVCKQCSKEFRVVASKKASNFCSHSCCSKFKWTQFKKTDAYKDFIENARKKNLGTQREKQSLEIRSCRICGTKFEIEPYKAKITCSKVCYSKLVSINSRNHPNCGGETNHKRYMYKDISMDSSWEVDIAKWMDKNNVTWIRSRKIVFLWSDKNGNKRRYYPDFFLPKYNIYLDPKNKFLIEKDKYKIEAVQKENNIKIICDIKDGILDYLKSIL